MATHYQSGSWSSPSILAGYGLSAVIGPVEPTKADVKRYNSRSGGNHSGHGNWMQTFMPRPVIKSGGPEKMYNYDFEKMPIVQSRLPSLGSRKVQKYRGFRKGLRVEKQGVNRDDDGGRVEPVVGAPTVISAGVMEWLNGLAKPNSRMDTESVASRRSSTTSSSSQPPERFIDLPGPVNTPEEQEALRRLLLQTNDIQDIELGDRVRKLRGDNMDID